MRIPVMRIPVINKEESKPNSQGAKGINITINKIKTNINDATAPVVSDKIKEHHVVHKIAVEIKNKAVK